MISHYLFHPFIHISLHTPHSTLHDLLTSHFFSLITPTQTEAIRKLTPATIIIVD